MSGGLPGGASDPNAGRAALIRVQTAIEGLRPDLAATVLIEALGAESRRLPVGRRSEFFGALRKLLLEQELRNL